MRPTAFSFGGQGESVAGGRPCGGRRRTGQRRSFCPAAAAWQLLRHEVQGENPMKKVRLAIGAAMPALGALAMPAVTAHAATAVRKPPAIPPAAFLHRLHEKEHPETPTAACQVANSVTQISANAHFVGYIAFDGNCVNFQDGILQGSHTGLTERVRFWDSGKLLKTVRNPGYISEGHTYFASYPNYHAGQVCEALVANGTSTVKYGPECEYT